MDILSLLEKDISIFKERNKIYCYTMYILFSVLSYQVHWHSRKYERNDFCAKIGLVTHISRFVSM